MFPRALNFNPLELERICRKWKVRTLQLFGSVSRGQEKGDSDIDLLVEFEPDAGWSMFDLLSAEEEFGRLFGRKADLVQKNHLKWVIKDRILDQAVDLYAAG